jgi:endonuclease/exonuclease/phosphatase family metal-dependent hydrolase
VGSRDGVTGQSQGGRERQAPDPLRIATFNVRCGPSEDGPNHWDARKGILLDALRDMRPHVLAVQECFPFQGDEIKMRFPHLDRVGVGRYHAVHDPQRPEESRSGEHCDIFFDTRMLLVKDCGAFWHSDTPETAASRTWGNDLPRITTWAVLAPRESGRPFAFFNTHYHWGEPYCTKTTDLLLERIRRHAGGLPCVLAGDFNLAPDSGAHGRLTDPGPGGLGLRDAWQVLGKPETDAGTHHDFSGIPKVRIDWILASREFTPLSVERSFFQREGRFPSDHFPVVAELNFAEEKTA